MLNDAQAIGPMQTALTLLVTYWVHSTSLLIAVWIGLRLMRSSSDVLTERAWKFAAVAGVFTALLQTSVSRSSLLLVEFPVTIADSPEIHDESMGEGVSAVPTIESRVNSNSATDAPLAKLSQGDMGLASNPSIGGTPSRASRFGHSEQLQDLPEFSVVTEPESLGVRQAELLVRSTDVLAQAPSETVSSIAAASTASVDEPPRRFFAPVQSLFVALVVVMGLGVLRLLLLSLSFKRHLRQFRCVESGEARRCLDKLVGQAKLRRPIQLFESAAIDEPMAFGLLQWRIVIPKGIEDTLPEAELRALLAHEMAHLVRGDAWWLWIGRVLCSCLPLQPLNFVARRKWQAAGEHQCDSWAVQNLVKPFMLARCLTSVAEWKLQRRTVAIGLSVSGDRTALTTRIERLTSPQPPTDQWSLPRRRRTLFAASVSVFVVLVHFGPRFEFVDNVAHAGVPAAEEQHQLSNSALVPRETDSAESNVLLSEVEQLRRDAARLRHRVASLDSNPAAKQLSREIELRTSGLSERTRQLITRIRSSPPKGGRTIERQNAGHQSP